MRQLCRVAVMVLATCVAAACDDDTTSPSALPVVLTAELRTENEVPPIASTSPEASARGAVQITLNLTRDSGGAISSATARFDIQMAGFPGDTVFVGAHIHPGAAGVNGPVVLNTGLASTTTITTIGSGQTVTFTDISVPSAVAQAMIDNPAGFYFNVHSFRHPGGVIRGQLRRTL